MQNLNEFGHRMHVASYPACVLGFFHQENSRKCIKCHKSIKFIMNAGHGDASVCKKFGSILIDVKKVHPDLPYRPTQTTTFEHGVLLAMHEITPIFASM